MDIRPGPTYYLANTNNTVWEPIDELRLPDRDLSLILIASNSVTHVEPNDDPVFAATIDRAVRGITGYLSDRFISPIACVDRHQICNPNINECTPLLDSDGVVQNAMTQRLALNLKQVTTVQRLRLVIASSTFYHVIFTRTQNFLRAQEKVAGITQQALPSNQWEIEMAALFEDTLSNLQYQMTEYAAGSSAPAEMRITRFGLYGW